MCSAIIDAYYVGTMTKKALAYYTTHAQTDFQIGSVHGGTYIHSTVHPDDNSYATNACKWHVAKGTGLANAIACATESESCAVPERLVNAIVNSELLSVGIAACSDICDAQPPILLVRPDQMMPDEYCDYSMTHAEIIAMCLTKHMEHYNKEYISVPDMHILRNATPSRIGNAAVMVGAGQTTLF